MPPSHSRFRYPQWLRITCCLMAVGCAPALVIAAICGAPITLPVAASIAGLSAYVVRKIV